MDPSSPSLLFRTLSALLVISIVFCRASSSALGVVPSTTTTTSKPPAPFIQDSLRKEYIKAQILQRLGLSAKPVVDLSHKISRDLVLETLRRAEGLEWDSIVGGGSPAGNNTGSEEAGSNYAKTSEIISFPDKGKESSSIPPFCSPNRCSTRPNQSEIRIPLFRRTCSSLS